MKTRKWIQTLSTGTLALSLLFGSASAYAAGVTLTGEAKQAYVDSAFAAMARDTFQVPKGWTYTKTPVGKATVETLTSREDDTNRVVLQLHGGGYVLPLSDSYRKQAIRQLDAADAKAIYMVDYRTAPQNIYPAAPEDAVAAYDYILSQGVRASDIIVMGDSAGGNLALAFSLYLKEHNKPQPALLIQTGGYELFLSENQELAKKAAADNIPVTMTVYPEMSHDFALIAPELKESYDYYEEIEDFIDRYMPD